MIQAITTPSNRMTAYAIRVEVEFLQEGQHLQHKLHAALPKQQATAPASDPIIQPIFF